MEREKIAKETKWGEARETDQAETKDRENTLKDRKKGGLKGIDGLKEEIVTKRKKEGQKDTETKDKGTKTKDRGADAKDRGVESKDTEEKVKEKKRGRDNK